MYLCDLEKQTVAAVSGPEISCCRRVSACRERAGCVFRWMAIASLGV
jgi:hypothetical protein